MPTFRRQQQQPIAQRLGELMNAPAVAATTPQRSFEMPREQGPVVSSNIATALQKLLGHQPDVAAVEGPESPAKLHMAAPDLFTAAVSAVKSLNARQKAVAVPDGRVPKSGRFEADVRRSLWLQERGE